MRVMFIVAAFVAVLVAPLASATTTTTRSCTLAPDAALSVGTCAVSGYANAGLSVLVTAWSDTRGEAFIDMANSAGGHITWSCALDGTAHPCQRVIDTGGPNAGIWTVTGRYAGASSFFTAGATMKVNFLTF
ncbi:MAG: hypothetical protein WDA16_00935 [Candidatus Thermoplasmatota archaeon]